MSSTLDYVAAAFLQFQFSVMNRKLGVSLGPFKVFFFVELMTNSVEQPSDIQGASSRNIKPNET
jgi:hypothetical protein